MAKVPPQRIDHSGLGAGYMPPSEPPALASALPGGVAVGRFVLDRVLHESAQGFVYLAHDAQGVAWVLKEYCPRELAMRMEDGSMRARQAGAAISISVAREAFRDEAETLARLAVPGLVRVSETLTAFHTLFRVMPLVAGQSLAAWVRARDEPASVCEVRALVEGLLEPLAALHTAGLLHGHIDPDQILVSGPREQPNVTLLGFGNATRELGAVPDEPWAAPELVRIDRQSRITTAADLYSLAACAWYATTAEAPPAASQRAGGHFWSVREGLEVLRDAPGDPPSWRSGLLHAIEAALAMAPEARPQRVPDMRRLLAGESQVRLISPQPAPLWVGEAPDRDEQRLTFQVVAAGPTPEGAPARPVELAERVAAPDATPKGPTHTAPSDAATVPMRRLWPWGLGLALLLLAGASIAAWWWVAGRSAPPVPLAVTPPPGPLAVTPPVVLPSAILEPAASAMLPAAAPAAAPVPVAAPVTAAPRPPRPSRVEPARPAAVTRSEAKARSAPPRLCAGKTQFALAYCLQEQCSKPALRSHPQCVAARRAGDVR